MAAALKTPPTTTAGYKKREATVGIEPTIGVLQTPALTTWPRRLIHRHDIEGPDAGQTASTERTVSVRK